MTREEAKYFWPIIKAYSEGKTTQYLLPEGRWVDVIDNFLFDNSHERYRIKQNPKYRQFKTKDECFDEMQKHKPFGWIKNKNTNRLYNVTSIYEDKLVVRIATDDFLATLSDLFYNFVFTDGTPFGIKDND